MSEQVHRRRFIQQAALGGVGLMLAGQATAADAPSNKVVLGVMGLSRGQALASGFAKLPGVEIKYVCDVDSGRVESVGKQIESIAGKAPQGIGDFRRILDDKEVDALVCAAPNHWHGPATILGCSAGKHVYVEKPCSHNPREGELMIEAARKNKRAVQMGSQRRSSAGTQQAVGELRDGTIGRVYLVRSWYTSARGSIGKGKPAAPPANLNYDLWQGPAPRTEYLDNRVHYNWHWFWQWGNGELGNNGVHTLDLCRWGLGVDFPIRVTSSGGRYVFDDDQETPDTHNVCFEFEGKRAITWQGLSCHRHSGGFVTFFGDKGTLDLEANGNYTVYDDKDKVVKKHTGSNQGDNEHLANFLDAIRNDKPLSLNAEIAEGHKSTLLCHLGNIAHRTGRTLTCDPTNGHILNDNDAMALWTRKYEPGWEPKV